MLKVFVDFKKFWKVDDVWINNAVFRLHYRVTSLFLAAATVVITAIQTAGGAIECLTDDKEKRKYINTYCWIQTTYTIPSREPRAGPYPGVLPDADLPEGSQPQYHKYYQWVFLMLGFQALCFYVPHHLWKSFEKGKVKSLLQDLQNPLLEDVKKKDQIANVVNVWRNHKGTHVKYVIQYFSMECLNLINVVGQIFLTDYFLNYEFSTYGLEVLTFSQMEPEFRSDPMARIFPKMTKCTFHKYGVSGTLEILDNLCVLPLNIVNEKIYIFFWFWFFFLAVITFSWILTRLVTMSSQTLRILDIKKLCFGSATEEKILYILEDKNMNCLQKIGNWQVLFFLLNNLDFVTASALINEMYGRIDNIESEEKDKDVGEDGDSDKTLSV